MNDDSTSDLLTNNVLFKNNSTSGQILLHRLQPQMEYW